MKTLDAIIKLTELKTKLGTHHMLEQQQVQKTMKPGYDKFAMLLENEFGNQD